MMIISASTAGCSNISLLMMPEKTKILGYYHSKLMWLVAHGIIIQKDISILP
jgi:hypothetical protein